MLLLLLGLPLAANAELRVFACEPEWSALAEEIGGDLVKATSATHALQDPHYVEARPSLISKVRKADLVVCSGAQLEIGWLPMLLSKANNPQVLPGKNGFLEASSFVPRLGVPDSVDRAQGDMHPQGNPHIQMNPHNISRVARALGERMALIDPDNAAAYTSGTEDFLVRWELAIDAWEVRAQDPGGKTCRLPPPVLDLPGRLAAAGGSRNIGTGPRHSPDGHAPVRPAEGTWNRR